MRRQEVKEMDAKKLLFMIFLLSGVSFATWYNSTWNYKVQVNLTGFSCPFTYCQYPINLTLNSSFTNGRDIRVVNSAEDTLIPFWREDSAWNYATASGVIWINATSGTSQVYVYYNATGVSDASNGDAVFSIFDDWNSGSVNTSKWTSHGTVSFTNLTGTGEINVYGTVHTTPFISVATAPINASMIGRFNFSAATWSYLAFSDAIDVGLGLQTGYDGYSNVNCPAGNTFSILSIYPKDTWGRLRFYRGNPTAYFYLNDFSANLCGGSFAETGARHFILTSWENNPTIRSDWIASAQMGVNTSTYTVGAQQSNAAPPAGANFTFISQSPADITSTNAFGQRTNITYNVSNLTGGTPALYYKTNKTTSDILYFLNGTAISGWQTVLCENYTGSQLWSCLLNDNQIYPATYNYNESQMENTTHNILTMAGQSNFVMVELLNISNTSQYGFFEMMVNGSNSNAITFYYCNSSYDLSSQPMTNANCGLFGSLPANTIYNHSHGTNSKHQLIPFAVNNSSGTLGGSSVKITPISYFIARSASSINTLYYYINATSRATAARTSTNTGSTWTSQNYTFDSHLHQFDGTDTLHYFLNANVSGLVQNSTTRNDTMELDPLPPTAPTVLTPTAGNKYGVIPINWTASQNLTPQTIYYNVSLLNPDLSFNKTLIANTSSTSYSWNSAGTPQANYTIRVMAINNYSQSQSGFSDVFTVATFNASLVSPNDGVFLSGGNITLSYLTTNIVGNASCDIRIDSATANTQSGFANTYSYLAGVANGSHTWLVNCTSIEDPTFSYQTASRSFSVAVSSFDFLLNLTGVSENVLNSPQALFYDVNGNLNVLYFTDDSGANTLRIKTIASNSIISAKNLSLNATGSFLMAMREQNQTVIFAFNASNSSLSYFLNLTNSSLTADTGSFARTSVQANGFYDPYTYANTKHFTALNLTNGSYYLFIIPFNGGADLVSRTVGQKNMTAIGSAFPGNVSWQTLANDSALSGWYFPLGYQDGSLFSINLSYYNGSGSANLGSLVNGSTYNASVFNASHVNFERYGNATYAVASNLPNTYITYIEKNISVMIPGQMAAASNIFFITEDTFVFFNQNGTGVDAFSCYFTTVGNCTRFVQSQYGIYVPYDRGQMTTSKRSGASDVVAKGQIISGALTQLYYNLKTYDGKVVCYDEQNDSRKTFTSKIFTDNSSTVLSAAIWGYVVPSELLPNETKKVYSLCENGTNRLYLVGLADSFRLDTYSLLSTVGTYYTFNSINEYGVAVSGVKVSAYRFSNAKQTWVVVEQGLTDVSGNAVLFLEPLNLYRVVVERNGYVNLNFDFMPTATTTIQFRLTSSTSEIIELPNFEYVFDDVSYSLSPGNTTFFNNTTLSYQVSSMNSSLEYYGMKVYSMSPTKTLLYTSNVSTSPSGGMLNFTTNGTGQYLVEGFFKHQNETIFSDSKTFYQNVRTGTAKIQDQFRTGNLISGWGYYLFALVIAMLVGGFVARWTPDGGGVAGLIALGVFTYLNPVAVVADLGGIVIYGWTFFGVCILAVGVGLSINKYLG